MSLRVYSEPSEEPVSLVEAKLHCRVDIDEDDLLISGLITTAREMAEMTSGRALITQTLDLYLEEWPEDEFISLPRPPLQSVTSVVYTDEDGTEQTLSTDDYSVDTHSEPGRVALKAGKSWPSDSLQSGSPIRVRYVAGYGTVNLVPQRYKQAILLLVGHWYENRENVLTSGAMPKNIPMAAEALLWIDRVW